MDELNIPQVWRVTCHTDHVGAGSTFVAIRGDTTDGLLFVADAIHKGASCVVVSHDAVIEHELVSLIEQHKVELVRVADTRRALAALSAQAYAHPAQHLRIIGITGTKGKTTTASMLHHVLQTAGQKAALIGTVENKIGDHIFSASLTTPQPDYIHMFLALCVQQGITDVVMEVAAQALTLSRVYGIYFDVGIFTNFAHEHLEFYASMQEYYAAKCLLREHMKPGAPIIVNNDDPTLRTFAYSLCVRVRMSDISVEQVCPIAYKITVGQEVYAVHMPAMMGLFNLYNSACALYAAVYIGLAKDAILHGLATFAGVKGRLQKYELPSGALCYIDYAHTPDSYMQVLSLLRGMTHDLTVVFGCGGLRDRAKRPLMGNIAASLADHVVLTSDNPRTEDPCVIMAEIKKGMQAVDMPKVVEIQDRAQAIAYACARASCGAIVAILGKGPDAYQIIGATKYFFSDIDTVTTFISTQEVLSI